MRTLTTLLTLAMLGVGPARAQEQPDTSAETATDGIRLVDDDPAKRWILHEPIGEAPEAGYGLLIVFPGGDGSPEFEGFVGGAIRDRAGPEFAVVQMIAPPIEAGDSSAIVWPQEKLPDDRVEFTIEPVTDRVIETVRGELAIDPERIYSMGWSSGGPPAYALSLREDSPVRGSIVAMSVFKPAVLPPLEHAAGRAYFLVHSPQDFIAMRFPEAARDELSAHGACVRLETYVGGHGWRGRSVELIAGAVRWLDGRDNAEDDTEG